MEAKAVKLDLPSRPGYGTGHKQTIKLLTNHYTVSLKDFPPMHLYDIQLEPAPDKDIRFLFTEALKSSGVASQLGEYQQAGQVLYSFVKLDQVIERDVVVKMVAARQEIEVGNAKGAQKGKNTLRSEQIPEDEQKKFKLRLTLTKSVSAQELQTYMKDRESGSSNPLSQIVNIVLRKRMQLTGLVEVGNSYLDAANPEPNPQDRSLQVLRGFRAPARVASNETMQVTIEPICRLLHSESLLEQYYDELSYCRGDEGKAARKISGQHALQLFGQQQIVRVLGVERGWNANSPFPGAQEAGQTFVQYYKQHNITVRDVKQPVVRVRIGGSKSAKILYTLPELLYVTGLSDRQRNDYKTMSNVALQTREEPQKKYKRIMDYVQRLAKHNDAQISLSTQAVVTTGHLLPRPTIRVCGAKNDLTITDEKGVFTLRGTNCGLVLKKNQWGLIYSERHRDFVDRDLLPRLKQAGKDLGIIVEDPFYLEQPVSRANNNQRGGKRGPPPQLFDFKTLSQEILEDVKNNESPQLYFSVLDQRGKSTDDLYGKLKRLFSSDVRVPHQNILEKTLMRNGGKNCLSICSKVLLQIAAKLGIELWRSQVPQELPQGTMLIGIDVYHKTLKKLNSVAAIVATVNQSFTQFYSKIDFHEPGLELLPNLKNLVQEAIMAYKKKNNDQLPNNIIVLRDGVSDGQVQQLIDIERKQIVEAFQEVRMDYRPSLAVILVNKRISDKFFAQSAGKKEGTNGAQEQIRNVPSGTLVTEDVTGQKTFEFFLVAQSVEAGTATPTRYTVIHDSTGIKEDTFHKLIYWQTFNYYNWCGPVRVPSVVQYAHKLAYFVGESLKDQYRLPDNLAFL